MPEFTEELYSAAGEGDANEVKRLLSKGAEVNARTRNGETALHSAAISGQTAVAELLLVSGADVNSLNSYGETPLERAVYYIREYSNKETVELLRRHGGILGGAGHARIGPGSTRLPGIQDQLEVWYMR